MNFAAWEEYINVAVLLICLCVGYIAKHWLPNIDNRIIPTLCGVLGVILCFSAAHAFTLEVFAQGLTSGLAATGMHQAFRQFVGEK